MVLHPLQPGKWRDVDCSLELDYMCVMDKGMYSPHISITYIRTVYTYYLHVHFTDLQNARRVYNLKYKIKVSYARLYFLFY